MKFAHIVNCTLKYHFSKDGFLLYRVLLPDFHPPDFAADSLRQFLQKFNNARIFIRSSGMFYIILQFPDQLLAGVPSFGQDDGGFALGHGSGRGPR